MSTVLSPRRARPSPVARSAAAFPARQRSLFPSDERFTASSVPALDTAPSLDDLVSRAWEGLAAGLPAPCPVCDGELDTNSGCCDRCGAALV